MEHDKLILLEKELRELKKDTEASLIILENLIKSMTEDDGED